MDAATTTAQRQVCVTSPQGLHARPADILVRRAGTFRSEIYISNDSEKVDCRSILSLLTLGATQHTQLTVTAVGPDAARAADEIGTLFDNGFCVDDPDSAPPESSGASQEDPSNP